MANVAGPPAPTTAVILTRTTCKPYFYYRFRTRRDAVLLGTLESCIYVRSCKGEILCEWLNRRTRGRVWCRLAGGVCILSFLSFFRCLHSFVMSVKCNAYLLY